MPKAKHKKCIIKRTARPLEWFMWFCLRGLELSYHETHSIFSNLPIFKKGKLIEEFVDREVFCPHLKGLPLASQSNTRHYLAFVDRGYNNRNWNHSAVTLRIGFWFFSTFEARPLGCSQIWECVEANQTTELSFDEWCLCFQRSVVKFRFLREIEEFLVNNSWSTSFSMPGFASNNHQYELRYESLDRALSLYEAPQLHQHRQKIGVVLLLHPTLEINGQPIADLTEGITIFNNHLQSLMNQG